VSFLICRSLHKAHLVTLMPIKQGYGGCSYAAKNIRWSPRTGWP